MSPPSGSTLITSAPKSASSLVPYDPISPDTSRTRIPSSGRTDMTSPSGSQTFGGVTPDEALRRQEFRAGYAYGSFGMDLVEKKYGALNVSAGLAATSSSDSRVVPTPFLASHASTASRSFTWKVML